MVRVTGFDHLVLVVDDVERSLQWYGELGLEPVRVEEWRAGKVPFPSLRVDATTIIDFIPRGGEVVPDLIVPERRNLAVPFCRVSSAAALRFLGRIKRALDSHAQRQCMLVLPGKRNKRRVAKHHPILFFRRTGPSLY